MHFIKVILLILFIKKKIYWCNWLAKQKIESYVDSASFPKLLIFFFLFGKHVLWFRIIRNATRKWLGSIRDNSKKGWDRLHDFPMVRFGSLQRCVYIERYRLLKRNEPFRQIERRRGSLFRFDSITIIIIR